MSAVYTFPFDIKAFCADVLDLNTEGQGAYLRLLLNYYQRGYGCATSVATLVTVTGLSEEAWQRHAAVILPLFEVRNGRLWHARCERELGKINRLIIQRKEAGQASADKRRKERDPQREGNERTNERTSERTNGEDTSVPTTLRPIDSVVSKEESPLRGLKKKAADAAPPAEVPRTSREPDREPAKPLHHPLASDFTLDPEDLAHCLADGADPPWVWDVFQQWKTYHLSEGTLLTDWKAAWWRRWEKSKPPAPVEQPKPKPRLVVSSNRGPIKTKLPADWQPNASNAAACAEEGYDLDAMAQHFRDVCGANGYRYVNHHLAFTNFIRNQKNFERGSRHGQAPRRGSIVEAGNRALANLDRKIREAEADEARDRDGNGPVQGLPED